MSKFLWPLNDSSFTFLDRLKICNFILNYKNNWTQSKYVKKIEQDFAKFVGSKSIPTKTLAEVFDEQLKGRNIDVLDIDTEGIDIQVLKSNNWEKYKPSVILVEDQDEEVENLENLETYKFLKPLGYRLIAKTISTAIYTKS
jgi:hypothetical protein